MQELDLHIIKLLATQKYAENTNRLVLNRNLNQCRPSKTGSALIIAFSGTGHISQIANTYGSSM